jgi:hypothetical protein
VETPHSDYIVEWQRSLEVRPGLLHRGRWATTLTVADMPEMVDFVRGIWRILFKMSTNRLRRVSAPDPHTPERRFRAGAAAFRRAREDRLVFVADALRLAPEDGFRWPD